MSTKLMKASGSIFDFSNMPKAITVLFHDSLEWPEPVLCEFIDQQLGNDPVTFTPTWESTYDPRQPFIRVELEPGLFPHRDKANPDVLIWRPRHRGFLRVLCMTQTAGKVSPRWIYETVYGAINPISFQKPIRCINSAPTVYTCDIQL